MCDENNWDGQNAKKMLKPNNMLKVVSEMLVNHNNRCDDKMWEVQTVAKAFSDHLVISLGSWRNQWDLRFHVLLVVIVTRKEMDTWWLVLRWNRRGLLCWDKTQGKLIMKVLEEVEVLSARCQDRWSGPRVVLGTRGLSKPVL